MKGLEGSNPVRSASQSLQNGLSGYTGFRRELLPRPPARTKRPKNASVGLKRFGEMRINADRVDGIAAIRGKPGIVALRLHHFPPSTAQRTKVATHVGAIAKGRD